MPPTKEELREYNAAELNFKKSLGDLPFSIIQKKAKEFKNNWFSGQKEPVVEVEVKEEPLEEPVVEVKEEPLEEPVVEVKEEPVEEEVEEGEIVEEVTVEKLSSDEDIPY
jgi:hypothetical protein